METKPRILIIDDEEVVLDACIMILEGNDYQIATASDGEKGLLLVQEFKPDIVFVDLKMPGLSGFEVLEKITTSNPTIVMVVITGFATVSSAVESMKKGAYDFLPKPFTPDELRVITRRGLEKRRLELETISLRREKEMLREHFAALVSHELKSPLGAIQQNLFVLASQLDEKLTDDQRARFERIKIRIDDLLQLIHTWLRVISVDINKIQESFTPVSLSLPIAKAVESMQPHATRKDIEIVSTIIEPVKQVNGNELTLVEVFVNILGNAVKYSHPGSKVHIKVEEREGQVAVSITDTGVGISKEDLPNIFEMFYSGKANQAT